MIVKKPTYVSFFSFLWTGVENFEKFDFFRFWPWKRALNCTGSTKIDFHHYPLLYFYIPKILHLNWVKKIIMIVKKLTYVSFSSFLWTGEQKFEKFDFFRFWPWKRALKYARSEKTDFHHCPLLYFYIHLIFCHNWVKKIIMIVKKPSYVSFFNFLWTCLLYTSDAADE